jgi:glutathione S-transferase
MVLTLYGYRRSTSTQRVLVVLEETKTPYTFVSIDLLKGEHLPKEHLDHNLFGQIPCLVRGILWCRPLCLLRHRTA